MAFAFRQHGVLATELLGATAQSAPGGHAGLTTAMDAAIDEKGLQSERAHVRDVLSSFFQTTTPQRAAYAVQLLDATFTLRSPSSTDIHPPCDRMSDHDLGSEEGAAETV